MTRLMNPENVPLSFARAELERAREQTLRIRREAEARAGAELAAEVGRVRQAMLDGAAGDRSAILGEMKRAAADGLRAREEFEAWALAELAAQAGRIARSAVDAQRRAMEETLREVGAWLRANHGRPVSRAARGA